MIENNVERDLTPDEQAELAEWAKFFRENYPKPSAARLDKIESMVDQLTHAVADLGNLLGKLMRGEHK